MRCPLALRVVLVLLFAAVTAALSSAPAAADTDRPLALVLDTAASEYPTGSAVVLTAAVTNTGDQTCGIAAVSEGSLRINQVTRDGEILVPTPGLSLQLAGLDVGVAAAAVPTDPGTTRTVPIDLRSVGTDSGRLRHYDTLPTGEGITSTWDLAEPGRYEVTALWAPPGTVNDDLVQAASGNPAEDPVACLGPSRLASVTFTITGPATFAWWWWLVIAAAIAVLLTIVMLAIRRSRRRTRAAAAVVLLLTATGVLITPAPPARADIAGIGGVSGAVDACLATFAQPGMDPAGTVAALNKPGTPPVRIQQISVPDNGAGTETNRVDEDDLSAGTIISWDPTHDIRLDDADFPPCLALYHELTHAVDMNEGLDSTNYICQGVPISDIHTVAAENLLRPKLGLGPREKYHGVPIPPITYEECKQKRADGTGGAGAGSGGGSGGSGPGGVRGGSGGGRGGSGPGGNGPGGTGPGSGGPGGDNGGTDSGGGVPGGGGIHGDPHLVTLDGLLYDLQLVGEFVALRVPDGPEVQVRTSPVDGSDIASMVSAVAVRVGTTRLGFYADQGALTLRRDGAAVPGTAEPIPVEGAVLQRVPAPAAFSGFGWTVTWPDGSVVEIQNSAGWAIKLSVRLADDHRGTPLGLLGNSDDDPDNDLVNRAGTPVPEPQSATVETLHAFGDSWRLSDDESLFDYAAGQNTSSFTDPGFPRAGLPDDAETMQNAQRACDLAGILTEPLRSTCLFDVLAGGQPGLVVQSAQIAAEQPNLVGPGSIGVDEPDRPASSGASPEPAVTVAASSTAPDQTVENGLQPGGSRSGTVTAETPLRIDFEASAGQVGYFRATGGCDPADFSVIWTVREVSGQLGEYHGTVGRCQDVGRASFTIDGTYAIEVTGTGEYAFTWEALPADVITDLPADGIGSGTLTAPTARHVFWFEAQSSVPVNFTPAADCPTDAGATWYVLSQADSFDGRGVNDLCQTLGPLDLPTGRYQLVLFSAQVAAPYRFELSTG